AQADPDRAADSPAVARDRADAPAARGGDGLAGPCPGGEPDAGPDRQCHQGQGRRPGDLRRHGDQHRFRGPRGRAGVPRAARRPRRPVGRLPRHHRHGHRLPALPRGGPDRGGAVRGPGRQPQPGRERRRDRRGFERWGRAGRRPAPGAQDRRPAWV
ncbi:MAG: hypothetical protein AVDCRST_MAG59-4309, partial [uncultured Thermomicrobiales bacterium]